MIQLHQQIESVGPSSAVTLEESLETLTGVSRACMCIPWYMHPLEWGNKDTAAVNVLLYKLRCCPEPPGPWRGCLCTLLHISERWHVTVQECAAFLVFRGNKPATLPDAPHPPQKKVLQFLSKKKKCRMDMESFPVRRADCCTERERENSGCHSLGSLFSHKEQSYKSAKSSVIKTLKDVQHVPQ